jgi:hypothetical protein
MSLFPDNLDEQRCSSIFLEREKRNGNKDTYRRGLRRTFWRTRGFAGLGGICWRREVRRKKEEAVSPHMPVKFSSSSFKSGTAPLDGECAQFQLRANPRYHRWNALTSRQQYCYLAPGNTNVCIEPFIHVACGSNALRTCWPARIDSARHARHQN